jgi:hypothetical protein
MNRDSSSSKEKQKGGFQNLINSIVASKINDLLGKYLNDIKKDEIKAKFGNESSITLRDLHLRNDAFDELRLPVLVDPETSSVKEVKCELVVFPTQVHISIKGVRATVYPNSKFWSSTQWDEYKKKRLIEWEENQKGVFENLNMKSYKQRKLNMVKNNINIVIEDIVILYEDQFAPKLPCVIRIHIQELKAVTTNEDFSVEKISYSDSVTYRKIEVQNLSVALAKLDSNVAHFEFTERMYLIRPFNFIVKYTQKHKPVKESEHKIDCTIPTIVISISDLQKQIIEAQSSSLANQSMYKKYEVYKTGSKTREDLWSYLINSCKKDMDINFGNIINDNKDMGKYIDYYKSCQTIIHAPWLRDKSDDGRKFLTKMEEKWSLEQIINYRTLALYQLRIEAMSYVKARGNVRGRTHLGDLWDYYLNDFESLLGDPYKTVAEEHEIELTPAEKEELNSLINEDKLEIVNSYLSGTSSSRNDKRLHILIYVEQIRVFVQDTLADEPSIFSTVNKSECLCQRCSEKTGKTEKSSVKIFTQTEDAKKYNNVVNMIKVNSEGRTPDPNLVKERTLLVIEMSLEGDFLIFRDLHLDKKSSKLKLHDVQIWDPLTLQVESKSSNFKSSFNFSSSSDLLQSLLDGNNQDMRTIKSFQFFLEEFSLLPEFEFLIHFKGVNKGNSQLCLCGKNIPYKDLANEFFSPEKNSSLHMNEEKFKKYQKMKVDDVYLEILSFFKEIVMPRYVRNCIRWIIESNSRQKNSSNPFDVIVNIGWIGKSSPLQVQFNKAKKKGNGNEFDQIYDKKLIVIKAMRNDLEINLSTETVHNLIKWIVKSESNMKYKNFTSTLSACHPKIDYIRALLTNLKKKGKQLYYILDGRKRQYIYPEIKININKIKIYLQETIFSKSSKVITTELVMENLIYRSNEVNKNSPEAASSASNLRLGLERDKKFYNSSYIIFTKIDVMCCTTPVMRLEELKVTFNDCLMKAHPYLIENITELTTNNVEINVCEEILGFLGLLATLDFTPIDFLSHENDEIARLKSVIFKKDKKLLKKQMFLLNQEHFKTKNLGKCHHCIILHKKLCKTFTFSIGKGNSKSSGLSLKLTNFLNKEEITLHCPLLCGISEEGVFKSTFSMFATDFDENPVVSLKLYENYHPDDINPYEVSPLFSLEHKTATSVPENCVTSAKLNFPLYLLLSMKLKKDPEIFDVHEWEKVDHFYKTHPNYITKIITSTFNEEIEKKVKKYLKKKMEIDEKLEKKYDFLKMNFHELEFSATSAEDLNKIFSVISSLVSFQQLYGKYQLSLYCNERKKKIILKNFINFKKIVIRSKLENMGHSIDGHRHLMFSILIENLDIQGLSSQVTLERFSYEIPEASFEFPDSAKFYEEDYKKYEEVIETLKDVTIVKIDSAVISLNNFHVKTKNFLVKTKNLTTQVQGLLSFYSNYSSNIIRSCLKTSISTESLKIEKMKQKEKIILVYLPYEQKSAKNQGFSCVLTTETENFKQKRFMTLKVDPVYSRLQAESLVELIKRTKELTSYLDQLPNIFQIPEKYLFHSLKFLVVHPFDINSNILKLYIEIRKGKRRVSTVLFENIFINNPENPEIFKGQLETFNLTSNTKDYSSLINPLNESLPLLFSFSLAPSQETYQFFFENCKVYILTKVIEDNVNVINFIIKETTESSSKEGKNSTIELDFLNSSVILPKSSKHPDTISFEFNSAKLSVKDCQESQWKLPLENQPLETTEKEVSLIHSSKEKQVLSTRIQIHFTDINAFYCDSSFGSVGDAKIEVFIPVNPMTESFILKNKVNLNLNNTQLFLSLYQMKFLEDLINTNIDEPLEGQEKVFKTKNTKFKFKVTSGKIGISRWVTKPWKNMNVIRIQPPPSARYEENFDDDHYKKSLSEKSREEEYNDDIQVEYKDDFKDSDISNTFDQADDGNRSLDEPEKESEELNKVLNNLFDTV